MAQIVWKQYGTTVPIDARVAALYEAVQMVTDQQKQCMWHQMSKSIFGGPYRNYKRGKNRCTFCGAKLKEISNG